MKAYKTLEKVFAKLNDLDQTKAILHWDSAVVMPSGGAEARASQLATLESLSHAILVDRGIEELLEAASSEKLDAWSKANLNCMKWRYKHSAAVPSKLLKELSLAGSKCEIVWRDARRENDFKTYAKYLKIVVGLVKEVAAVKAEKLRISPYDALIDQYDPGLRSKDLDKIFDNLKEFLPDFTKEVIEKQKKAKKKTELKLAFPKEKQLLLVKSIMEDLGFDFNQGRLDESNHPFCGGYQSDVRLTTRYNESDITEGLMGVLHETGHALYESGLPAKFSSQPVGAANSISIHESQSLFFEMQMGRSREFIKYLLGKIKKTLEVKGKEWSIDNLYSHYTKVEPSLIRVDADEVTYPSHVMLRYYIERYLIDGEMEVDDLPDAWNQGMKKFVGVTPKNFSDGCMQDIHWADGTFGYFPTYTVGAIVAAQFYNKANSDIKDLGKDLEKGKFDNIVKWAKENVHQKGSKFSANNLVKDVTGNSIDVEIYKNYLQEKYLKS